MREGWKRRKIADLVEPVATIDPRKKPAEEFTYIDVSAVSRETHEIVETSRIKGKDAPSRARRLVRAGDVIFATIRPTLQRIAEIPPEFDGAVCSTGYFALRPKRNVLTRFLFYSLFAEQFSKEIAGLQRGAAYPAVSDGDVKAREILVPPLPEQKRIVAILDEAFAGIATAVANTEKNLANARELFESYLNAVFVAAPNDWAELKLSDICTIKHGFAFKSKYFGSKGAHVVLTPGSFFESGGFRDQGPKTKYYNGEIPQSFILDKGDFLIAMTEQAVGLLGSSLIVPEANRYLHNQRLGLVRVRDGFHWHNEFFFHQFNTRSFREAVQSTASGVKVRHTSPAKLGAIKVKYPPTRVDQESVAKRLDELLAETHRLESVLRQKLIALSELKQSLLQKAFSGELTAGKIKPRQTPEETTVA